MPLKRYFPEVVDARVGGNPRMDDESHTPDATEGEIGIALVRWWKRFGRSFPWRYTKDPYKILIAEVMLQRTRAEQVVPVYLEFIKKYPKVESLARANPRDVEHFFRKLGMVNRAERIIRMAKYIVENFSGRIPSERKELLRIPGIGEYIADALLVFAFNKRTVAIDSNIVRVVTRLFCITTKGEGRRDPRIRRIVEQLVPPNYVREFNWALIDLAAVVCRPRSPQCDKCPLRDVCCHRRRQSKDAP